MSVEGAPQGVYPGGPEAAGKGRCVGGEKEKGATWNRKKNGESELIGTRDALTV